MAGKTGMSKGNMGGQREGAGRLGQTARLKVGDKLNAKCDHPDGGWSLEYYEVIEANRRVVRLKAKDGSILSLWR